MLKQIWKERWTIVGFGLLLSIFTAAYLLDDEHSQDSWLENEYWQNRAEYYEALADEHEWRQSLERGH